MDAATVTHVERQFLGCLLWLSHEPARSALAGMRADDMADPACGHVLQLVIEVTAAGHAPAPVDVFAHAVTTGQAPGEYRRSRLGSWLAETYGAAQLPTLEHATYLKVIAIERAWRRAVATHAHRLAQAAEDSPTDVLAELADDTSHADQLWQRYQQTLGNETHRSQQLGVVA